MLDSYAVTSDLQSFYATRTSVIAQAPINNPAFNGTVSGITKDMVGLGNVDNITDLAKPVSTATQAALNLKANLNNPTFTGTLIAPTINALSALQIHGTSTDTLYAWKPWAKDK